LALALGFRAKANVYRFQFGQYLGIPLEAFNFFPRARATLEWPCSEAEVMGTLYQ
jgi:hypothetical protein